GRTRQAPPRADRGAARKSAIPYYGSRLRLSVRGTELTGKIFLKLIGGLLCVLLLALVTVDYFATQVAKNTYIENLVQQVADKGRMLELSQLDPSAMDSTQLRAIAAAADGRITVVRSDGKVLLDSDAN